MILSILRNELEKVIRDNASRMIYDFEFDDYLDLLRESITESKKNKEHFKLYRFSPVDYWNIRNFECSQLMLTPIGRMNDAFEGAMTEPGYYLNPDDMEVLGELVSLKCFSEDWQNLLMWAHYANNYSGLCVEYDLSLLQLDDHLFDYLFPVIYSDQRRQISHLIKLSAKELRMFKAKQLLREDPDNVSMMNDVISWYLTKSIHWEYEKEWRIVVPFFDRFASDYSEDARHKKNVYENGIVPFDCATSVYLGTRISSTVKDNIIEIAQRINARRNRTDEKIKVFQTVLGRDNYLLDANQIIS